MKTAVLGLIAMLTLPAMAQKQPEMAFYGMHVCDTGSIQSLGGQPLCLDAKPLFAGAAITAVSRDVDAQSDQETAIVTLGESASILLYAYTAANPGQRLGITLDGALVSTPVILAPIRSGQVTVYGLSHAQIAALVARSEVKTP